MPEPAVPLLLGKIAVATSSYQQSKNNISHNADPWLFLK
jgi:hypothetical protein